MSLYCNICDIKNDHKTISCLKTQCKICQGYGHINIYCPTMPCRVCNVQTHILSSCKYENVYSKNFIYSKTKNGFLGCGCLQERILSRRKEIKEYQPLMSKGRIYHCCKCADNISVEKIIEDNNIFYCKGCYKVFIENLPNNDQRKIEYMQSSEYQRDIVICRLCNKTHHRVYFVEGAGDFCDRHHQIAYLVSEDIENPNKSLWTRIIHRTESSRTKMSAYPLNQSAIMRIVLRYKNAISITFEEALKEQIGDIWNSAGTTDDNDDWNAEDYRFTRVIDNLNISSEQELEKQRLRKLILESFDFSSNIDIEEILN
ncbi:4952_t:CDS:1, partial [Cetraspora pellucida]